MTPMHIRRLSNGWQAALVTVGLMLGGCAATTGASDDSPPPGERSVELSQLMSLAEKSESAGNHGVAANIYREASRRYPEAAEPRLGLGRTAYASGRLDDAAQAYRDALSRDRTSHEARYGLGKALLAGDRLAAAIAEFDALINAGAAGHRPYLAKGVALDLQGRHREAQSAYRAGLERAPDNVALRNNLGLSLALAQEHHEAMRVLEELTRDPTAPSRARQNLALVYGLAGQMNKAAVTAGEDLEPERVERNLAYYQTLSTLRNGEAHPLPAPAPQVQPRRETAPEAPADAPSGAPQPLRPDAAGNDGAVQLSEAAPATKAEAGANANKDTPQDPDVIQLAMDARQLSGEAQDRAPRHEDTAPADHPSEIESEAAASEEQPQEKEQLAAARASEPSEKAAPENTTADGRYWVQLASFTSTRSGRQEWQRLREIHPELIGDLPVAFHEGEIEGQGTVYRVRTGPFAAREESARLCDALQARDQACLVVQR